jgi:hypothetical protein
MEVSEVRKRVLATIERAKRTDAERRTRSDEAARDYPIFLERVAVPLFRQVANILKAHGYAFTVFTPSGGVRLMSEKSSDDFIELSLDTRSNEPVVIGHVNRGRGRRVIESERPIGSGPIPELTEDQVLEFLMTELEPFVER